MPIRSIEIICLPCPKCQNLHQQISTLIKTMEMANKIKIIYDFTHTTNLKDITKHALNPSQTPAIVINGKVELAGGKFEPSVLKSRLEAIHRMG